jgi:hypothetical protein
MQILFPLLIIAGFYPLVRAWRAQRRTSLQHAVVWAGAAWAAWGLALVFGTPYRFGLDPWRYLALCLTGGAGVAVLGARRPGVAAWDLVVVGLLAVMLLPLGESLFLGTPAMDGPRLFFLGATLAVGILNYVPTALAMPALFLGAVCLGEWLVMFTADLTIGPGALDILHLSLLAVPWLGLPTWRRARADRLVDRLWLDFRDCFGLFWGQRVRDQYNRGAAHAGLPGYLYWHGWEQGEKDTPPTEGQWRAMEGILTALLQRFGNEAGEN